MSFLRAESSRWVVFCSPAWLPVFREVGSVQCIVGFLCPTCSASRSEESERSFPVARTTAAS